MRSDIPPGQRLPDTGVALALRYDGLVFGQGTQLVRFAEGGAHLALDADRDRCLAMLSVVAGRPVTRESFGPIEAAAVYWQQGDKALANLRLVFASLPKVRDAADAARLRAAEYLLDNGITPGALMKELGLDASALDLGKYDPDQPRVPAGSGRESGRWRAIWNDIVGWLEEPVPEYDTDTGTQVGTRSRGRAIATNPLTIGIAGAAALLGGEAIVGALAPVTIADVLAVLPEGMTAAEFGRVAGFVQGLTVSGQASVEPTTEAIASLQEAGITKDAISLARRFYAGQAKVNPNNFSAVQRAALLSNILKRYK